MNRIKPLGDEHVAFHKFKIIQLTNLPADFFRVKQTIFYLFTIPPFFRPKIRKKSFVKKELNPQREEIWLNVVDVYKPRQKMLPFMGLAKKDHFPEKTPPCSITDYLVQFGRFPLTFRSH